MRECKHRILWCCSWCSNVCMFFFSRILIHDLIQTEKQMHMARQYNHPRVDRKWEFNSKQKRPNGSTWMIIWINMVNCSSVDWRLSCYIQLSIRESGTAIDPLRQAAPVKMTCPDHFHPPATCRPAIFGRWRHEENVATRESSAY